MKYRAGIFHGFTFEPLDSRMHSKMLIAAISRIISSHAIISSRQTRIAKSEREETPFSDQRFSSLLSRDSLVLKIFAGWSEESKVKLNVDDRR